MNAIISTEHLLLRPFRREDADLIVTYLDDFEVAGNLARVPHPYGPADAEMWLNSQAERPDATPTARAFAIEIKGEGYAGTVGIHPNDSGEPVLGYWLGKPFWGQGYMTEAAGAIRDWFFRTADAPRVLCGAFPFNTASLAIQRKLGFVESGRSSVYCLARGKHLEHIDTTLTRARYDALRADEEAQA